MVSNDALQMVSVERRYGLENYVRCDELMAVSHLHRTPTYACDPIAVTLEHRHLAADGHLIGIR